MLELAPAIVGILSHVLRLLVLFLRLPNDIRAENLVLRRLAQYIKRRIKPRQVDPATCVSRVLFPDCSIGRAAVVNVPAGD